MSRAVLFVCVCAVSGFGLRAEGPLVTGPVAGFHFDRNARSIRPIVGVPGASYLGAALVSEVAMAGIAPDGATALVARETRLYWVRGLKEFQPEWTLLDDAVSGVDRVVWSRESSGVAVYSGRESVVQVFRREAGAPRLAFAADLSSLRGRVSALEVGCSARFVVVGVEEEATGGVYLVAAGGRPELLARLDRPSALALSGCDEDLFVADAARQEILEIRNIRTAPQPLLFASRRGESFDPVGLAVSRNGRMIYVADGAGPSVAVYERASQSLVSSIPLEARPTRLEEFSDKRLYFLNSGEDNRTPLLILEDRESLAVHFVPRGAEEVRP